MRYKALMATSVLGLVTAGAVGVVLDQQRLNPTRKASPITAISAENDAVIYASHVRYGHAVVAGGVHTKEELLAAYPAMDANKVKLVMWTTPIDEYVTYLKDGERLWTREKKHYAAGQLVWTDGTTFVLAKCGNQISLSLPPANVTEATPPSDLDTPQDPVADDPSIPDTFSPVISTSLLNTPAPPSVPGTTDLQPSCAGCDGIYIPSTKPPVPTPEPPSGIFAGVGLALFVLFEFWYRSKGPGNGGKS